MARGGGGGGGRRRRRIPPLERKYGFFFCASCQIYWGCAHVYCVRCTKKVYFKQECNDCRISINPHKVKDIQCPQCELSVKECQCYLDEHQKNPAKPHRADLCQKCQTGWLCTRGNW